MPDPNHLGKQGEQAAADYLKRQCYAILETNYQSRIGEMDLIALDPAKQTVCFVEVKTRSSEGFASAESAVNADKRRRLKKIAAVYLKEKRIHALGFRFDVIAVHIPQQGHITIRHLPDCF